MTSRKRRGRHEGSVYQKGGRWVGTKSVGYGADGRRRRVYVYADSKKAALDELAKVGNRGIAANADKLTVGQWLERWLGVRESEVSRKTHERLEGLIRLHITPHIGHLRLDKLAKLHIEELLATHKRNGLSASTRVKVVLLLKQSLCKAVDSDVIQVSPAAKIARPQVEPKEMFCWSTAQCRNFLAAAKGHRHEALYTLAVTTGMRMGELLALRWVDISFPESRLSVQRTLEFVKGEFRLKPPKTKAARRRIDLPAVAVTALAAHRKRMLAEGNAGATTVFCEGDGGFIRGTYLTRRSFVPLTQAAGLPAMKFHGLRHSAATSLLEAGTPAKVVQELLGHSHISITLGIYGHVTASMQAQATARMQELYG